MTIYGRAMGAMTPNGVVPAHVFPAGAIDRATPTDFVPRRATNEVSRAGHSMVDTQKGFARPSFGEGATVQATPITRPPLAIFSTSGAPGHCTNDTHCSVARRSHGGQNEH